MDPVSMAVGVVLFAAGAATGRLAQRRRGPAETTEVAKPICGCDHPVGMHDDGGPCLAQVQRPHYLAHGPRNGWEWVACPCRRYVGPVPIDTVWVPPIVMPKEPS